MKICIFKHKKLYNNALISFITFFLLFLFLIIPNEDWYGWGEYSHNLSFLTRLLDNLSYIDKTGIWEDTQYTLWIIQDIITLFLLILCFLYFIYTYRILVNMNKNTNYYTLIAFEIIYLISLIVIFLIDIRNIIPTITINKYLSTIMLTPIFIYSFYNLIYTFLYKKTINNNI